jgi:Na(+)-translocating NADH:ubiquinone oxidoreductase A subunit
MSKDIRIKKGLDLKLKGEAEKSVSDVARSKVYAIKPSDFHGVIPKMVVKEGASVKAGEVVFYSKNDEAVKFVSPVSGTIQEIKRGEKRVILEILIGRDFLMATICLSIPHIDRHSQGHAIRDTNSRQLVVPQLFQCLYLYIF